MIGWEQEENAAAFKFGLVKIWWLEEHARKKKAQTPQSCHVVPMHVSMVSPPPLGRVRVDCTARKAIPSHPSILLSEMGSRDKGHP